MSKLILTNEVSGLGSAGDVVEVKDGYARNFLIPNGLAVVWSKGGEKQVTSIRAARQAREIASEEDAKAVKAKLEEKPIRIAVKAGTNGRLFGAVKTTDIAEAVVALGITGVDKRKIELSSQIRTLGEYEATVRVTGDLVAQLKLQVVAAK
ncbi:50S ribosomal protein L9 [Aquiluna borgnonia]|jgi:large subunit ribosomal protein L9|uniref:Large ribosomal subunit protein bL9 n=1 Tax=Aquiluna borgnonia TaxID=2499157 RepID=A0A7D4PZT6_9MICO|nr:50S ribosomal protein L9 [Aquiluna borgnonia]QKJ25885.1 50S ribosomal protein L9 [Aquiluna borgnonia]